MQGVRNLDLQDFYTSSIQVFNYITKPKPAKKQCVKDQVYYVIEEVYLTGC